MHKVIATIKQSDKIINNSEKMGNHHQICVHTYQKAINREANNNYQKATKHWLPSIISVAKKTSEEQKIEDKV